MVESRRGRSRRRDARAARGGASPLARPAGRALRAPFPHALGNAASPAHLPGRALVRAGVAAAMEGGGGAGREGGLRSPLARGAGPRIPVLSIGGRGLL